jgi:hypothetical protein
MDKENASKNATPGSASEEAAKILNSILTPSDPRQISETQIMLILDALAGAPDPALVARFPAVLALCARRDIELNSQKLLGRYWESSAKRQNLEMLLFISAALFRRLEMAPPGGLPQIAASLKGRHAHLSSAPTIQLAGGPSVAVNELEAALKHAANAFDSSTRAAEPPDAVTGPPPIWSSRLPLALDLLFSEKQKELVFKRLKGESMTKTEREYYSRVVKKKLAAIADKEMQRVAALLGGAEGGPPAGATGR